MGRKDRKGSEVVYNRMVGAPPELASRVAILLEEPHVGALYSGSQEVHNLLWKMRSDLCTVSTLRYYEDSDVLVQSPSWQISA